MKYRVKESIILPNRVCYKIQKKWFIFWFTCHRFSTRSGRDFYYKILTGNI